MSHFSKFGVLVAAGIGMLAGVTVMAAVSVRALESQGTPISGPGTLSVGQLAAFCRECGQGNSCGTTEQFDNGYCQGVVSGVMDSRPEIARLCLPEGWNLGQETKLFLAWAAQHPGEARSLATDGIVQAHSASFDCRKSGGGV